MKSSLTKPMMAGVVLCLVYYALACWISYGQLSYHFTLWLVILFGSGFAGFELSVCLLIPISKDVKSALGILLGVNGAVSAVGWIFLGLLPLFLFGLLQFFYFSCFSIQAPK